MTEAAKSYLKLLEDLLVQMDNDPTLENIQHFMQDGPPPQYELIAREFLDRNRGSADRCKSSKTNQAKVEIINTFNKQRFLVQISVRNFIVI